MHRIIRIILILSFLTLMTLSVSSPACPENFIPTCYDDGISCPGDCDAHVVLAPEHNGTPYAFSPQSTKESPRPCMPGQACTICFAGHDRDCMTVLYRGAGPPPQRFDFTPAFYAEACNSNGLPERLERESEELNERARKLREKTNCFKYPEHPKCKKTMGDASNQKATDNKLYQECLALGEEEFNLKYHDMPELQRTYGCAYEKHGTGKNISGLSWKRLLPAACRPGTYVGENGFDCCGEDRFSAACLQKECSAFFR